MSTRNRSYTDYVTGQFLLMEWGNGGWIPTQTLHQRIYCPTDNPTTLISMPGHISWPNMMIAEQANILIMQDPQWTPVEQIISDYSDDQINIVDDLQAIITVPPLTTYWNPPIHQPTDFQRLLAAVFISNKSRPPPPPFPKHLAAQVLEKAETDKQICPITMEPIQKATGTITSCGHIFAADALYRWLLINDTCPECRSEI